jgi:hypothetical protein
MQVEIVHVAATTRDVSNAWESLPLHAFSCGLVVNVPLIAYYSPLVLAGFRDTEQS